MAAKKKAKKRRRRVQRRYKEPTAAQVKERLKKAFQPSYRIICYYRGFDPGLDDRIAKLARRPIHGSGSWLELGLRDLEFDFETKKASALKAAARIKDARIRGVRVMIDSIEKA